MFDCEGLNIIVGETFCEIKAYQSEFFVLYWPNGLVRRMLVRHTKTNRKNVFEHFIDREKKNK